ncbi:MAG TPA: choice-of-anchor L domain-containing protein [Bacteroidia bacterium]|nr:choice-of-anchor L domain-containing protein [Bacteroidia bacterium]
MKKILFFTLLTIWFSNYFGQITTSINPTIAQMQALLQGNGVTVTGLSITCPAGAYATFNNAASTLGGSLNSGILLTTGTASLVSGPNPNTTSNNLSYDATAPGSALGNSFAGGTTYDGCYINFMLTPTCATLSINYVFASEEYPEWVGSTYNDVFGFVLSGPKPTGGNYTQTNISTIPGTSTPVTINNVNAGSNSAYYIQAPPGLEYDGRTTILTASASVIPCQTYTMTIGVWDDGDGSLDSGVFLDVNGLSCPNQPTLNATVNPTSICGPQTVSLTVVPSYTSASGSYTWSAPASGGLASTSGTIVTANPTGATTYTVKYSDINTCPGFPATQTVAISFSTTPSFPVTQNPTGSLCVGQSATLTASGGAGTYSWVPGTGLSSTTGSVVVTTPTATTTYTVTKTNGACSSFSVITVNVNPSGTVAITPSISTICAGQSVVLTSGGAGPYTWTASSGTNPPSVATVTVSPTITTTYSVLVGSGTCTSSAVATVSISATPSIAITPSLSTICVGQSVTLTSSGAGPFVWTASSGSNPAAAATVTVSPTTTTTYSVLSGSGTCTASAVAIVSISTVPSISITPSSSSICAGQNVVLSSSGAGPFTWTASSGSNPPAASTVTVSPSITTTYSVLSGSGTCTASATATVTITPMASVSINPSLSSICIGQNATLTASGSGPFTWSASDGSIPPAAGTIIISPTVTTTYTVISGVSTCTASAVATISIATTPSISITPASTIICTGQSTNLSVIGSSGPFVWTASAGTNPSATGTVTVNPSSTTTYSVLSGTGTCTASAVATVSVSPMITVAITPSATNICIGSSTNLSATGATSYTWIPGFSTSPILSVTPTTTSSYTVIGTDGVCTNTASATVGVTSLTTTVNSNSAIYCLGVAPVSLTGGGATTYSWSPSVGLSSTSGAVVTATPATTTIYTVTGTTNGCNSTNTISITIPPLSTLTATSSNSIICVGNSSTLSATGANTYTWNTGATTSTNVISPSITTTYTVTGQTAAGCFAVPAIVTVTVLPTINPALVSSSPTVCLTKTVSVSTASVVPGLTYTWQPTSAISGANNNFSITALPPSTATVVYTVTISNGICVGTNTIQIQIKTPPDIKNITTLNNDTICVGGCVTFSANTTGSMPIFYQWYYQSGVGTSSVGVAPEACYPSAGSFSVVATASNTCGVDTLIKTNFVTVFDMPVLQVSNDTTINIGESATVSASGGVSYSWSPNINGTIACPTCSSTVVSPTLTTNYIVVASNSIYCKVQDTVTVIVDVNCGDFFIPNVFSPNGDGLNDMINVHGRCISTFNLQIFNRWGEKVFETSTLSESWDGTFRGQKLDTGVFVYKAEGVSIDGQEFKLKGNITLLR